MAEWTQAAPCHIYQPTKLLPHPEKGCDSEHSVLIYVPITSLSDGFAAIPIFTPFSFQR